MPVSVLIVVLVGHPVPSHVRVWYLPPDVEIHVEYIPVCFRQTVGVYIFIMSDVCAFIRGHRNRRHTAANQ